MYLIHLRLRCADGHGLPEQAGAWLRAAAAPEDGVEHVAVHAHAQPDPVLGVYLLADRLEDAEERAVAVCRRVLAARRELRGWELVEGRAPLIASFYEGLLAAPGVPGRNRPGTLPST
jgi:hypothetical protein